MEYNDGILGLTGSAIWKGGDLTNGKLLKSPQAYHYTIGYSQLIIEDALISAGHTGVPFGAAVWYDRQASIKSTKPGAVYGGIPTASGAVPVLAGIMILDEALLTGQPLVGPEVLPMNKGRIGKRGFVMYKHALNAAGDDTLVYADVSETMSLFVQNSTGLPVMAVGTMPTVTIAALDTATAISGLKPVLADHTYIGKIVNLEPENEAWIIELDF